jgi:hypothetical protein
MFVCPMARAVQAAALGASTCEIEGQMDLGGFIDSSNVECANENDEHPIADALDAKGPVPQPLFFVAGSNLACFAFQICGCAQNLQVCMRLGLTA